MVSKHVQPAGATLSALHGDFLTYHGNQALCELDIAFRSRTAVALL